MPRLTRADVMRTLTRGIEFKTIGCGCGCGGSCGGKRPAPSWADMRALNAKVQATLARTQPRVPTSSELDRQLADIDRRMARLMADVTPVSAAKRAFAREWADLGCAAWGIPRVTIIWRVSSMKAGGGFHPAEPQVIKLNPLLSWDDVPINSLHEVSHAGRYALGLNWRDEDGVEADAQWLLQRLRAA